MSHCNLYMGTCVHLYENVRARTCDNVRHIFYTWLCALCICIYCACLCTVCHECVHEWVCVLNTLVHAHTHKHMQIYKHIHSHTHVHVAYTYCQELHMWHTANISQQTATQALQTDKDLLREIMNPEVVSDFSREWLTLLEGLEHDHMIVLQVCCSTLQLVANGLPCSRHLKSLSRCCSVLHHVAAILQACFFFNCYVSLPITQVIHVMCICAWITHMNCYILLVRTHLPRPCRAC